MALALVGGATLVVVWLVPYVTGGESPGSPQASSLEAFCPERVAESVPGAGVGVMVAAYETERHRIVLCANEAGELFYFGEFLSGDGETMVLPATRTEQGYVADAGRTRYEIVGDEVVITGPDGLEVARLDLVPVESPR
ncbi:hypothetical protein DSY14_03500 [Nocardiopsis sp. MG754419]|nr:hypothetical protein [Nocardiopsis sp. MG754419]